MKKTPQATSPLATWLHYIETVHVQEMELGLTRIRQVAEKLALLKPAPVIFTVAGTNGKGTTCRTLEVMLLAAGYRVGVFSSPHLIHYTERVRIEGKELSESDHVAAFVEIEAARGETALTYFEFNALSALWLFKRAGLDAVILEVGLGGRLDATNIVDSDVAIITSIGLDHTEWLGHDRESIGREKAGIFRADKPAIVGDADMPVTVAEVAHSCGAQLSLCQKQWSYLPQGSHWSFTDRHGTCEKLPLPLIPLANAATAFAALRASPLCVSEDIFRSQLGAVTLPGRFQVIDGAPRVILDVAHNPHAAHWLASQLRKTPTSGKVRAVLSMLHDKDIVGTLAALMPEVDQWYCATLGGPRGATAEALVQCLPDAQAFASVSDAWQTARADAGQQDTILVCGSFHTVAQVMVILKEEYTDGQ
ncbi:MAG: Dihydrofolate synthase/folylpolyglutamate synthase [Candidatus Erwinia impunctatus]|nr:Dihydrofolate synthase/folylpolyglutamate synthase [Culicoides impunctatus]